MGEIKRKWAKLIKSCAKINIGELQDGSLNDSYGVAMENTF